MEKERHGAPGRRRQPIHQEIAHDTHRLAQFRDYFSTVGPEFFEDWKSLHEPIEAIGLAKLFLDPRPGRLSNMIGLRCQDAEEEKQGTNDEEQDEQ